jgi:hypothetical protein
MRSHEVLGLLLKQPVVKKKLQPIFTYIIQRFPAIFENIPCAWREKCLTAIAQKCNYNMRRRRVRSVSPVHITDVEAQGRLGSPALMSDAVDPRPSKCLRSLDTITVHTIMVAGGKYSICRLLDLARKEPIRLATVRSGPDRGQFWRPFKKTGLYGPAPPDCSSVPKILDRTERSGLFII